MLAQFFVRYWLATIWTGVELLLWNSLENVNVYKSLLLSWTPFLLCHCGQRGQWITCS